MTTQPTADICNRIRCGAITQSQAGNNLLLACAMAGYSGSLDCTNPICQQYLEEIMNSQSGQALECNSLSTVSPATTPIYVPTISGGASPVAISMPRSTSASMPNIVGQARVDAVQAGQIPPTSVLNPRSILKPLPQIVPPARTQPLPQTCSTLTAWVAQNPLLAAGVLVAAFFMVKD